MSENPTKSRKALLGGALVLTLTAAAIVVLHVGSNDQQNLSTSTTDLVIRNGATGKGNMKDIKPKAPGRLVADNDKDSWLLRVMTFNLRFATSSDGANRWEMRRDHVADIINRNRPLVLGTQEGLDEQLADLHAQLKYPYERFGEPRQSGDEHVQIFYDSSRLSNLENGTFWLSETMKPGSKGWDGEHVRIATWGRFRETQTGNEFVVVNTQLDNSGKIAQQQGAKLIWRMMQNTTAPLVLLGDFNTVRSTSVHAFLTTESTGPRFLDAWMEADRVRGNISNSYHNFIGPLYDQSFHPDWIPQAIDLPMVPGGNHIDWIFVRPEMRILSTEVITEARDGRYPSDHYPIQADIEMTPPGSSEKHPK